MLARRNGAPWYRAGINGQNGACDIALDLSFLGDGKYDATWIEVGQNDSFADRRSTVTAQDTPGISMPPGGGFVAQFTPADT